MQGRAWQEISGCAKGKPGGNPERIRTDPGDQKAGKGNGGEETGRESRDGEPTEGSKAVRLRLGV